VKNLDFEIRAGEAVGIIGANGAGKSTLLKILSRITTPTEGRVDTYGRTGTLLEVGTGFHPELTGRENIYLNGAILGMRRREIDRRFDEIIEFAGVANFIDTPVKRFSSGMIVRLAFAVAANLNADILLVDEVLAVGDVDFQKKSLAKMHDVAEGGRTVLFVSHSLQSVSTLCTSAMFLKNGELVFQGPTRDAIAVYLDTFSEIGATEERGRRAGSGEIRILEARPNKAVYDPADEKQVILRLAQERPYHGAFFISALVYDEEGRLILHLDSRLLGAGFEPDTTEVVLKLRSPWLKPGKYSFDFFVFQPYGMIDEFYGATRLQVSPVLPYQAMSGGENSTAAVLGDFSVSARAGVGR
jgi:lipopolysaccharide transport system ATP-binding protein